MCHCFTDINTYILNKWRERSEEISKKMMTRQFTNEEIKKNYTIMKKIFSSQNYK